MGNKNKTIGRQQSVKIPPSGLKRAGAQLLAVYAQLSEPDRHSVEDLLLQHAFLLYGPRSYEWCESNECDVRSSYLQLLNTVSADVAEAWFQWAKEISKRTMLVNTCRKVVLGLVRQMVVFKYLEKPLPVAWVETEVHENPISTFPQDHKWGMTPP